MSSAPRCKKNVWARGSYHPYQCSRAAKRDGYCKQHHPDAEAERRRVAAERYDAKIARLTAPAKELATLRTRLAEAERLLGEADDWAMDVARAVGVQSAEDVMAGVAGLIDDADDAKRYLSAMVNAWCTCGLGRSTRERARRFLQGESKDES